MLLESFVESLPTSRLLLLVNYRPQYQHGWANKTYYSQLRLDPLPPESAGEILNSVLGNDHGLQSLKQLLIERTEGNPFFLEESVRTLVETNVLVGERGNYHLEKKVESTQVPATVQAVLAARIDRLPPQEKQLLQSAAVIGKDVPFSLLQAITELSDAELRRGLTRLQAAEFLYETSLFPDLEYTFKHALTHEVAYGSLLHERQRALHARIVEAIETLYPDRMIEQVERLAHQQRGGGMGKGPDLSAAGRHQGRCPLGDSRSGIVLREALTALGHLPEIVKCASRPSTSTSACVFRWGRSGNTRGFLNTCAQPKPWQMLWEINAGWRGLMRTSRESSWHRASMNKPSRLVNVQSQWPEP